MQWKNNEGLGSLMGSEGVRDPQERVIKSKRELEELEQWDRYWRSERTMRKILKKWEI